MGDILVVHTHVALFTLGVSHLLVDF
jgi:hypothetical protein